jgi:hypothetical protein
MNDSGLSLLIPEFIPTPTNLRYLKVELEVTDTVE